MVLYKYVILRNFYHFYFNNSCTGINCEKNNYNNLTGLVVGLTLIFLIYTGFYVSGSSMNPVRSFAPAFFEAVVDGNTTAIKQIWIYIAGPFIGSSFAVLLYLNIYN